MIGTAVKNSTNMIPITCCGHEIPQPLINAAMPANTSDKYHQLLLEKTGKHTMFCPQPKYSSPVSEWLSEKVEEHSFEGS